MTDDRPIEREQRVTPLELFFDLVFVFAITHVTGFPSHSPTWGGLLPGLLLLGALWWAWGAYAWLTNTLDPEEGAVRLAVLAAVAAQPSRRVHPGRSRPAGGRRRGDGRGGREQVERPNGSDGTGRDS